MYSKIIKKDRLTLIRKYFIYFSHISC